MSYIHKLILSVLFVILLILPMKAQIKRTGVSAGLGAGASWGETELRDRTARFQGRGFLRYGLTEEIQAELGGGYSEIKGESYRTALIPIDFRFVFNPFSYDAWNPFLYAGVGALNYKLKTVPPEATSAVGTKGWTGYIPAGLGVQFALTEKLIFEASGGYNYTFSDNLNGYKGNRKDAFWGVLAGITVTGETGSADPDNDGLTNDQEKALGTDPQSPDTDGDGLTDGDEVNRYHTSPLMRDSDGDGLRDGDEIVSSRTDPQKSDTDGDGLSDGDEITKFHSDPLKMDTDGDGLTDGQEITKTKTDPLKADTDGDSLSDGDEVDRYKTNPLKADTDGGTVSDGKEIQNKTNPLDPVDDVPKKEEIKAAVGVAIVLEGITFKSNKAEIIPSSEKTLTLVLNTLVQHPDIEVLITGHTDNIGNSDENLKLSQQRADAVKTYLVKMGIDGERISTKGLGETKPLDSNGTEEGRKKNRRIEFIRTK